MKHFKKIAAAAIAVMMVFAMCVSTLAATITVTGGTEGQEYSAYLIFNLETTTVTGGTGYIYYLDYSSDFVELVKAYADSVDGVSTSNSNGLSLVSTTRTNSSGDVVDTYEVQVTGDYDTTGNSGEFSATAFAAYLKAAIDKDTDEGTGLYTATATATASANGGTTVTAELTANEKGYYFINTNLGSIGILRSSTGTIEIQDKNASPTPKKEATTINGSTSDGTVKIGDTVGYTITVTAGEGAVQYDIIVNDILSEGLTYTDGSISITDNKGNNWIVDDDYEVEVTSNSDGTTTLKITLLCADNGGSYLSTLTAATDEIYITYNAVINEKAASYASSSEGITNDVSLTYGREGSYTTQEVEEKVETFRFGIEKTDGTDQLAGAVFNVYSGTDTSSGSPLGFVETTGTRSDYHYYRLATSEDDAADIVYDLETSTSYTVLWLEGLDAGTYTIVETEAPAGYNMLNGTITLVISDDGTRTFTYNGTDQMVSSSTVAEYITIENSSGSTLPTTGGMGTKIFYTLGGILVVGAGILLITKRRMNAAK